MEAYLQLLKEDGWKGMQGEDISTKATEGNTQYSLIKDDRLLQIMMSLKDKEAAICNSILVRLEEKVSLSEIQNRKNATTKDEALDKIKTNLAELIKQGEIPYTKGTITGLFEIFLEDAYDKLQLQAYAAISDRGFAGCFLIRKGVVSYVKGNLSNACIVDIDGDGNEEIIDLYTTWVSGIYKIDLIAYEYSTPIFFSSNTQILQRKYSNSFVPDNGYEEVQLVKVDDTTVKLAGALDYGTIKVEGTSLVLDHSEDFPFTEWAVSYDQSRLLDLEKEIPVTPPQVIISMEGLSLDYVVSTTKWDAAEKEFTTAKAVEEIMEKNPFIPTIGLNNSMCELNKTIVLNFGSSIPDSIKVYDAMLDDQGGVRYGGKLIMEQAVKILDGSRVSFNVKQHMAYFLSSYSGDYEKDWRRLFRVVCRWGEKECVYALLINTGNIENLTEITDHQFLNCEGSFSKLSSSWGLGITIDSTNLPRNYVVEWQVSDGFLRKWSELGTKPIGITEQHNGYPMTFADDNNNEIVIWAPISFDTAEDVTIKAFIYESKEDKSPIAYSQIVLVNDNGMFYKK
jgi:L-fucose mutarotase/ribose pyranase (RbsD/FucU family)